MPAGAAGGACSGNVPRGHLTVAGGYGRSDLNFADLGDATVERDYVFASNDLFFDRFTLTLGAGTVLGGSIVIPGRTYQIDLGALASIAGSWRLVDQDFSVPWVVMSATLSGLTSTISHGDEGASYHGTDIRLGVTSGYSWTRFSPYVTARVFGGPAFLSIGDDVTSGGDRYHVQVGAGAFFFLPEHIDLFVEAAPFGEISLVAGAGWGY